MAAEDALGGAGFGHDDFREEWQMRFESVPDPDGDLFAGGVFEAGDFVEVTMIELFPEWPEGGGDVGVIDEPAELRITEAGDDDLDFEAMSVQAAALVVGGQLGEEMGGLELEGFA